MNTKTHLLAGFGIGAIALVAAGCNDSSGTTPAADGGTDGGAMNPPPDAGAPEVRSGPTRGEPDLAAMVRIPAGKFNMGRPVEKAGGYGQSWKENELPAHEVTLPEYFIDKDEVTVARYAAFLAAAGGEIHRHPLMPIVKSAGTYAPAPGAEKLPINFVSFHDAATYCAWAGGRLPTEAEWERAARGPKNSTYPWGEEGLSCDRAVAFTSQTPCERVVQPVGSRSPRGDSAEGLHDMAGNVAEWVGDYYDAYATDGGALADPRGPATGKYRVVRGGGFRESPNQHRSTARWGGNPNGKSEGMGFRCVLRK